MPTALFFIQPKLNYMTLWNQPKQLNQLLKTAYALFMMFILLLTSKVMS